MCYPKNRQPDASTETTILLYSNYFKHAAIEQYNELSAADKDEECNCTQNNALLLRYCLPYMLCQTFLYGIESVLPWSTAHPHVGVKV